MHSDASALQLVLTGDAALLAIVRLSLAVSLSAVVLAALIGIPFGAFIALTHFRGREAVIVLLNALNLVRRLAALYGGRPGALGLIKLFRQVMSHLAVTGGVSVTDSLIQQVVGHGIAARLSARFGEGLVNGLLTARLGLLAIDLTRPMPFAALSRPALNDLAAPLLRTGDSSETPRSVPPKSD